MTSPWILQTVSAITIFRQANMAVIVRNTIFFITCYSGVGNFSFNYYMISLFLHNEKKNLIITYILIGGQPFFTNGQYQQ